MRLTGLIAAPHTPFRPDGSLNLDAIPRQADRLAVTGVSGAFVCGTTGEGPSLSGAERRAVVATWVTAAAGRFPVVAHVGHTSAAEARELADHAATHGVSAVAAVAPFFARPGSPAELARFLAAVAAGVPELPFYFYDIPAMTGVTLPTAEVMEACAGAIPNFAGVKYSKLDLIALQECLTLRGGEFDVLYGVDEQLLGAVALGVKGAVGSTYNFAAPLYRRMLAAAAANEWTTARRLQRLSVKLVRVMERFGGVAGGKAIMRHIGIDCGAVRPPMRPLTELDDTSLHDQLTAIGFFSDPEFAA